MQYVRKHQTFWLAIKQSAFAYMCTFPVGVWWTVPQTWEWFEESHLCIPWSLQQWMLKVFTTLTWSFQKIVQFEFSTYLDLCGFSVHSSILSVYHFLCLPFHLSSSTVSWNWLFIVYERTESWWREHQTNFVVYIHFQAQQWWNRNHIYIICSLSAACKLFFYSCFYCIWCFALSLFFSPFQLSNAMFFIL